MFDGQEKMTDITQCPHCGTHFNITSEQSRAHEGQVRCGHCQEIFNAVDNLYTQPPQQLDLPLVLDDIADATGYFETYKPPSNTIPAPSISPEAAARLANDFSHIPDIYVTEAEDEPSRQRTWLWISGSVIVGIVLLLQSVYFFRVDIAARFPGMKPAMLQICAKLKCALPLPQKLDQISIESSELESDPTQANIITLHATLRSSAPYAMSYPHVELTLTDLQDSALARRSFSPAQYLPPGEDEKRGIPANRESTINLHLNTTDLKPAGYRLFLFYPQ